MSDTKERLIKNNNKLYWKDKFINDIYTAAAIVLDKTLSELEEAEKQMFFDTMTESGVLLFERYLNILPPEGATIAERRQNIQSNWLATKGKKFTIQMVKDVCEAWEKGAVSVEFKNSEIVITFIDAYGIPKFYKTVESIVESIKPAHLGLKFIIKYNTHRMVGSKKHVELTPYTHKGIRESDLFTT